MDKLEKKKKQLKEARHEIRRLEDLVEYYKKELVEVTSLWSNTLEYKLDASQEENEILREELQHAEITMREQIQEIRDFQQDRDYR